MNPQVDAFLRKAPKWRAEMSALREILLKHPLVEELKWGKPCYTFEENNILIIQPFKAYCALMFCKGVLLKDARKLLVAPGTSTQAGRQLRFTGVPEIRGAKAILNAYVQEAITAQKAGRKVEFKTNPEPVPEELKRKLENSPVFNAAFSALTPGRQRGYILFISAAKQSATREARIEKHRARILAGKGLHD